MSLLQAACHDAVLMISAWKAVNSPFVTVLATALFGGFAVDYLLRMRERVALERRDTFDTKRQLQLDISQAIHAYLAAAIRHERLREIGQRSKSISDALRPVPIFGALMPRGLRNLRQEAAAVAWDEAFKEWSIRRQEIAVRLRLRFGLTQLPQQWESLANNVSNVPARWGKAARAGESPSYASDLALATGQAVEFLTGVLQAPLSPYIGKRSGPRLGLG